MDLVITAVKSDLDSVLAAGHLMLTGMFLLAVFNHYVGILQKEVNWMDVTMRLVIGFVLLQNYVWIMDTTRDLLIGLDERINPEQSYITQYAEMGDNMQKEYEANTQKSFVEQAKDFLFGKFTLHNIIINLSFIFYAIVSKVMEAIRYSLVGILYKLGPILVPLILFPSASRVLKGWYTHYISVLCWPILWHIALSVAVSLSEQIGATGQGIEQFACLNFAVCFVLIFSPMIVSGLVAGVGMGGASSLAGFMASNSIFGTMSKIGHGGLHSIGKAFEPKPAPQNNSGGSQTPTTTGDFKDAMTRPPKNKGQNNE